MCEYVSFVASTEGSLEIYVAATWHASQAAIAVDVNYIIVVELDSRLR